MLCVVSVMNINTCMHTHTKCVELRDFFITKFSASKMSSTHDLYDETIRAERKYIFMHLLPSSSLYIIEMWRKDFLKRMTTVNYHVLDGRVAIQSFYDRILTYLMIHSSR